MLTNQQNDRHESKRYAFEMIHKESHKVKAFGSISTSSWANLDFDAIEKRANEKARAKKRARAAKHGAFKLIAEDHRGISLGVVTQGPNADDLHKAIQFYKSAFPAGTVLRVIRA